MSRLAEKIRKLRQITVPIEGKDYAFVVSRPTEIDVQELRAAGAIPARLLVERFVVGWEGVREMDIIPGGDPHPIEFDREACVEWLSDDVPLLQHLLTKILEAYGTWHEQREAAEKN